MKIKQAVSWMVLLVVVSVVAGCDRQEPAANTPAVTATRAAAPTATQRPTVTPTPRPTATPTPTPEPLIPAITVADQTLGEDGVLTMERVVAAEAGWLVLLADEGGQPGRPVAFTAVAEGEQEGMTVTIDPLQASPTLHARLHVDRGQVSEFEFPGVDEPLVVDDAEVTSSFVIEIEAPLPAVMVSDQAVGTDGMVRIDGVFALEPGWLALHQSQGGGIGPVMAYARVEAGANEGVALTVDWRQATPMLVAALYHDGQPPGRFDAPAAGRPVVVNENLVASPFRVSLPPDVLILDQPVVNGTLQVERVVSNGPGWVALHVDNNGVPGLIIGLAHLEDGLNEAVVVEVPAGDVTEVMYAALHSDDEPVGEFNFPAADLPLRDNGRLPEPVPFRAVAGNYLITRDQALAEDNTVVVPLVVVDQDTWVVIRAEAAAGEPGEIIGRQWLAAGINRNVAVPVDLAQVTATLYADLHQDVGTAQQFEFPDGPDTPVQRNRSVVRAPFSIEG